MTSNPRRLDDDERRRRLDEYERRERLAWEARQRRFEEDERRRKALAERLAMEMAAASHRHGGDFIASRTVQSRLHSIPEVAFALADAPVYLGSAPSPAVGAVSGPGGLAYWIHEADLWSMAFVLEPFTGLIRVCPEDLPDRCVELFDDSEEARSALSTFYVRVVAAAQRRVELIASGFLPPDPPIVQVGAAAGGRDRPSG